MTRFALIPLAFFANACASADEVQGLVEETAEETRYGVDDIDYSKSDVGLRLLEDAQRQFQKEMAIADCEMVGALAGQVSDSKTTNSVVVDIDTADVMAKLRGEITNDSDNSGSFYAQDTTMNPFNSIRIEGDWDHEAVEASVFATQGRNQFEATLFATMTERGDSSSIIGAIALCR